MENFHVRRKAHWMILSVLLAAGGCGGDIVDPPTIPGIITPPPVATTSVTVADFSFTPPNIRVSAGATVTWTWTGNVGHNVTFAASSGIANAATQITGTHQVAMPTATGVYTYMCTIHGASMSGSVLVP